jgi:hypothetical protein
MSKFNPTPGEWLVDYGTNQNIIYSTQNAQSIATVERFNSESGEGAPMSEDEFDSNTKLIAAAKDLYKALQECMKEFKAEGYSFEYGAPKHAKELLDRINN